MRPINSINVCYHSSAVAQLHWCNGHSNINRKIEISIMCRTATAQNFISKFDTRDYVWNTTPQFWRRSVRREVLPKYVKNDILWLCTGLAFFSWSCPQVKRRHWCTRLMAQTTRPLHSCYKTSFCTYKNGKRSHVTEKPRTICRWQDIVVEVLGHVRVVTVARLDTVDDETENRRHRPPPPRPWRAAGRVSSAHRLSVALR